MDIQIDASALLLQAQNFKGFRARAQEAIRQERINAIPAGRLGQADEFGKACAFLASSHAGYITGQNLLIDGGAFRASF